MIAGNGRFIERHQRVERPRDKSHTEDGVNGKGRDDLGFEFIGQSEEEVT